jgi:Flp pilus assembly pilin Flp
VISLNHSEVKGRTLKTVRLFLKDASGATVIEYALIAGIVSVSIVGLTRTVGLEITRLFEVVIQSFPK